MSRTVLDDAPLSRFHTKLAPRSTTSNRTPKGAVGPRQLPRSGYVRRMAFVTLFWAPETRHLGLDEASALAGPPVPTTISTGA